MISRIIKNSNIRLCIYIIFLLSINSTISKYHIFPSTHTYSVLESSMVLGSTIKMESFARTFYVWTPIWLLIFAGIFAFCAFFDQNFFVSNTLSNFAKLTLLPFALLLSIHIFYSTYDLLNMQMQVIEKHNHISYISDISLETLDEVLEIKPNSIIYIESDGCPSCIKVSNTIDNIAYSNNIHILRYDTIYDKNHRPNKIKEVLDKYCVYEVPCILMIKNGKIVKQYFYNEIINGNLCSEIEQEIFNGIIF